MTNPTLPQSRLFFDISSLVEYIEKIDRYSGIQRVVSMLMVELSKKISPDLLYVSYFDRASGLHKCLRFDEIGADVFLSPAAMRSLFFRAKTTVTRIRALDHYADRPGKYVFHRTRLDILSVLGKDKHFRRFNMTAADWYKSRFGGIDVVKVKRADPQLLKNVAAPGDKMILLDSTWKDYQVKAFIQAKASGLVIYSLVHDLIPLLKPAMTDGLTPSVFLEWLTASTGYTDKFLANSEATRRDLADFLTQRGISQTIPVVPLVQTGLLSEQMRAAAKPGPLRADIDVKAYPELYDILGINDQLRALINTPYVLCVGTIEARKNGWRLALAWKYLLEQGYVDLPRLVFAGRKGWLSKQLFDLLDGTGNLFGYVSVIDGPSDEELDFLYRHCLFVAMPSLYEGWGLPVGEALSYGKTAVISNTSSLPEVGQDFVEYCDPESVLSIAKAVLALVEAPARREELEHKIASAHLRDWSDVARDLLLAIE